MILPWSEVRWYYQGVKSDGITREGNGMVLPRNVGTWYYQEIKSHKVVKGRGINR